MNIYRKSLINLLAIKRLIGKPCNGNNLYYIENKSSPKGKNIQLI